MPPTAEVCFMLSLHKMFGGMDMTFPSRVHLLAAFFLVACTAVARAEPDPKIDQDTVKKSIEAGVAALKAKQKNNGFWLYGTDPAPTINSFGSTALAALTLLECGVPS